MRPYGTMAAEAQAICKLPRAARRAALDLLPEDERGHVRALVNRTLSLATYWQAKLVAGAVKRDQLPERVREMMESIGM